jgi:hypothetical protein
MPLVDLKIIWLKETKFKRGAIEKHTGKNIKEIET